MQLTRDTVLANGATIGDVLDSSRRERTQARLNGLAEFQGIA